MIPKLMRIAHIQFGFSTENGWPTRSLSNFCRGQVAAGHEVSVWALEGFQNLCAAFSQIGYKWMATPTQQ
jgi:hypothetical protein